ncbi:MAG TPA: hypothetical protein DCP51_08330 [Clostridiales bacterium]|nr:hypothetical protein [Clostridiales bacterium]
MLKIKKIVLIFLLIALTLPLLVVNAVSEENEEVLVYFIDGENVTRWADTSVVYRNKKSTEQNEWGYNVVVDSTSKVIKLIDSGDTSGKNLVIPDGGMVISATGIKTDWLKNNVVIGDFVYYDKISSRILVSKDGIFSPYYTVQHIITGFNDVRYAGTFLIYDKGETTETNGYGYEVCVNSEGVVISSGGNNNIIPNGGFVISAIEQVDKEYLKMYGLVGSTAKISADKKTLTLSFDKDNLQSSIQLIIENLKEKLNQAIENYWNTPYDEIGAKISEFEAFSEFNELTLQARNEMFVQIDNVGYEITESPAVELRGIWHETVEIDLNGVKKVVADLKEVGINQLNLGITSGYNTILPLTSDFPFKQKASLKGFDLLQAYIDECHAAEIELVLSVAIFRNSAGEDTTKPEWLTKSNGKQEVEDESKYFFNPANSEYRTYMIKYLTFILENYNIDGLQLDYIRYPASLNGIDYGYDELTKSMFEKKYNVDVNVVDKIGVSLSSHALWDEWVNFKGELVTSFVKEIRTLTNTLRPDIYLSAAVASDTVLSFYHQDTERWMKEDLLDAIYPMTYGEGVVSGSVDKFAGYTVSNAYLFMGIGSYLGLTNSETFKQIIDSRYKADGACFFEYFSYFSDGYSKFLLQNAFRTDALTPTYKPLEAAIAQINFAIDRINDVIIGFDGISTEKAATVIASLENLKKDITLEKTDSTISEICNVIKDTKGETAILKDLAKLRKIVLLSKDAEKVEYITKRNNESETESEQSDVESNISAVENKKSSTSWGLITVISILVITSVAIFVFINRKK